VRSRALAGAPAKRVLVYALLDLNASIAKGPIVLRFSARNAGDTRAISQAIVLGSEANTPVEAEIRILQPPTIWIGFDSTF
jgi:hypothetical protein